MNYGTGLHGFVGSHLSKKLDITPIPHDKIQTIKLKPFDRFFFLSSYGNLASQTDENEIFKANVEDLLAIVKQIKDMKFKSFVFLSSSSVRLKEQTTYSRAKRAAEQVLRAITEKHNLPICIIQPFSVYGPGEQTEHLIPTILRSCYTGEKMNFVKEPVHDYIYIDDLVDGIITLSNLGVKGVCELGTGVKTSNQEVLELIEEISDKKANVNIVPSMRAYDNQNWVSTNFRARGYGWLPKVNLRQGLEKMVKDYAKDTA